MVRQDLYRAVNLRIHELTSPDESARAGLPNAYVCECGHAECRIGISLTWEEFEEFSADPDVYLVAPGHVGPLAERVRAGTGTDYAVIRVFPARVRSSTEPASRNVRTRPNVL